jgi:hypothetical protein
VSVIYEVRTALSGREMDVMELVKVCPSAKDYRQLSNVLAQLAFRGRILRAGTRYYTVARHSNRTKTHEMRQRFVVWKIGDWPGDTPAPAENLPRWIAPEKAPEVKGLVRTVDKGMHRG